MDINKETKLQSNKIHSALQTFIDTFSDKVAILDKEGKIYLVNQAWIDFCIENGIDENKEWIGTEYPRYCCQLGDYYGEGAEEAYKGIEAILNGEKEAFELEYTCQSSPEKRWFMMKAKKIALNENIWIFVSNKNITTLKESLKKLDDSKRFSENLIQTANALIVVLDTDGNIIFVNPKVEEITGYIQSEIKGKNWFRLIVSTEEYPKVYEEFKRLIKGGLPKTFQNYIRTKNGEERYISWSNNEVTRDGKIVGLISFGVDMTEQKHALESILQYKQRLKKLASQLTIAEERERKRIAGDLHDGVGQMLAFSRMQLAIAKKSNSKERQDNILEHISDTLFHAIQKIRNLVFELSPPLMTEVSLETAISQWLEEQIEKRYDMDCEFADNGIEKNIDEDVRFILFRNVRELLTNIVKHAKAKKVSIRIESNESRIKIIVKDDGIGFDYEKMSSDLRQEGGFGLISVKERMINLGGSLEIISSPGEGCTAILSVPITV